jgi:hypothetical protein
MFFATYSLNTVSIHRSIRHVFWFLTKTTKISHPVFLMIPYSGIPSRCRLSSLVFKHPNIMPRTTPLIYSESESFP